MKNTIGNNVSLTIWGESHGKSIGAVFPAGHIHNLADAGIGGIGRYIKYIIISGGRPVAVPIQNI